MIQMENGEPLVLENGDRLTVEDETPRLFGRGPRARSASGRGRIG